MLADDFPALLQGLMWVAVIVLFAAIVCAFPLIWHDWKRDLDARVQEDAAERPPAPPYNWEIEEAI